jgi:hypothetical protein
VGFVLNKVALEQVSSEYFGFLCHFSFHRLLHTHHLSSGAGTIGQILADVPSKLSLTPPQETKKKKYISTRPTPLYPPDLAVRPSVPDISNWASDVPARILAAIAISSCVRPSPESSPHRTPRCPLSVETPFSGVLSISNMNRVRQEIEELLSSFRQEIRSMPNSEACTRSCSACQPKSRLLSSCWYHQSIHKRWTSDYCSVMAFSAAECAALREAVRKSAGLGGWVWYRTRQTKLYCDLLPHRICRYSRQKPRDAQRIKLPYYTRTSQQRWDGRRIFT